ncbi:MAG: DNA repair protein [Mariniblastus sp.]
MAAESSNSSNSSDSDLADSNLSGKRLSQSRLSSGLRSETQRAETVRPDDHRADSAEPSTTLRSPAELRKRMDRLVWMRDQFNRDLKLTDRQLAALEDYLGIADQVTVALDTLSQKLFEEVLGMLQDKLTIALQEVLEQPIKFRADASFKRGSASVDFSIDRNGNQEDVKLGQGGSVQNVLSVGLRLFALARLNSETHRRFLVLDEQDCWLRPELVPRLVNIVHRAAKELNFQVIMISHHDVGLFEKYADKIYRFTPKDGAITTEEVTAGPMESDSL